MTGERDVEQELRETQQRLRETEAHLDLVLEASEVTAARVDTDLEHTWVHNANPEGPSEEEVLGKRDDELFPAAVAEPTMALKRDVRDTESPITRTITFQKPDRDHVYRMHAAPIHDEDGSVVGVMHAAVDITDRDLVEQQLTVTYRLLRHDLRNRLTALLGRAEIVREELESLDHLDGTRQLLRDIDSAADALRDGVDPETVYEALRSLKYDIEDVAVFPATEVSTVAREVEDVAKDMIALDEKIDQFLRVSRHTEESIDRVPARPVLERLVAESRANFPAASLEIECADDVAVRGTEDAIELAVGELVENALAHNDSTEPVVEINVTETDTGRVAIEVSDNGPGLPDEEYPDPDNRSALHHGSGVGLWIAKWVTIRLGGPFEITENDPRGTAVTVNMARA